MISRTGIYIDQEHLSTTKKCLIFKLIEKYLKSNDLELAKDANMDEISFFLNMERIKIILKINSETVSIKIYSLAKV